MKKENGAIKPGPLSPRVYPRRVALKAQSTAACGRISAASVGLNVHNYNVHGHNVHAILSTVRMSTDQNIHSQNDHRPKCPQSK